jgi:hypothetical protein
VSGRIPVGGSTQPDGSLANSQKKSMKQLFSTTRLHFNKTSRFFAQSKEFAVSFFQRDLFLANFRKNGRSPIALRILAFVQAAANLAKERR